MPALHCRAELFFCVKNDVHMLQVFKKICDSGYRPNWVEQVGFISIIKKNIYIYFNSQPIKCKRTKWGKKTHKKHILVNSS